MFDPWSSTFEEAMSENRNWSSSGKSFSSPKRPFAQFIGANLVIALKDSIDRGSGYAVLHAIRICVTNGLVAPEWLAFAFNRRYDVVADYRAMSWDDSNSFGKPYPKGTNKAARRKARLLRTEVWNRVVDRLHQFPDTPIDKGLFEEIGKPLGLGATLTEEYYYDQKRHFGYDPKSRFMKPIPVRI